MENGEGFHSRRGHRVMPELWCPQQNRDILACPASRLWQVQDPPRHRNRHIHAKTALDLHSSLRVFSLRQEKNMDGVSADCSHRRRGSHVVHDFHEFFPSLSRFPGLFFVSLSASRQRSSTNMGTTRNGCTKPQTPKWHHPEEIIVNRKREDRKSVV